MGAGVTLNATSVWEAASAETEKVLYGSTSSPAPATTTSGSASKATSTTTSAPTATTTSSSASKATGTSTSKAKSKRYVHTSDLENVSFFTVLFSSLISPHCPSIITFYLPLFVCPSMLSFVLFYTLDLDLPRCLHINCQWLTDFYLSQQKRRLLQLHVHLRAFESIRRRCWRNWSGSIRSLSLCELKHFRSPCSLLYGTTYIRRWFFQCLFVWHWILGSNAE
ncbi:hypothetical protein BT96DRAFT_286877 [Gymnopus androsaceus JB14]|uniref:Uncharacterized protein n=1 Tax=Gymnopus androsaceus JB14 TaxID=1447944 RepID=A0A6A4H342_9AGAR|nr:hypothetical protein BT96DRAFT_286877 [Gymnopus androsaceus JB14]